jgi:predicted enzyme related to lactoylglutathione lyase
MMTWRKRARRPRGGMMDGHLAGGPSMHKSRLGTVVIDCQTQDIDAAASFWSAALGRAAKTPQAPNADRYRSLEGPPEEVTMLVQAVEHPSRVHLDIETDDIEAELARLEALGAKRVAQVKSWWVMEAPTGQRFCVVRPQRPDFEEHANVWPTPGSGQA